MMNIQEFHKYNRLVRRAMVEPLMCESCEFPLTTLATEDAEPVLKCYSCGSLIQPGLKMYERICAVNREWYT